MIHMIQYSNNSNELIPELLNNKLKKIINSGTKASFFCIKNSNSKILEEELTEEEMLVLADKYNVGAFYGDLVKNNGVYLVHSFDRNLLSNRNYIPEFSYIKFDIIKEIGFFDISFPTLFMYDYYLRITERRIMFHLGKSICEDNNFPYQLNEEEFKKVLEKKRLRLNNE